MPTGPCCMVNCKSKFNVAIFCKGGGRCPLKGTHHIFHPQCGKQPGVGKSNPIRDGKTLITKSRLKKARELSDPKYTQNDALPGQNDGNTAQDHRWRKLPSKEPKRTDGPRDLEDRVKLRQLLCVSHMPVNAVLCTKCWNASQQIAYWEETDGPEVAGGPSSCELPSPDDNPAAAAHAASVVHTGIDHLLAWMPALAVIALAQLVTLAFWLGRGCGKTRDRIWLNGRVAGTQTSWAGGVLNNLPSTHGGDVAFAPVAGAVMAFGLSLCATPKNAISATAARLGDEFWAAVGDCLWDAMRECAANRLERITLPSSDPHQLNSLTAWSHDWDTLPDCVCVLLTHTVQGRREREAFGHQFSASRAAQKNRAVYAVAMQLLYAINPRCDQPIHAMMNRNLYYSGGSWTMRELCARLGWTIARSTGAERRLFEPLEQDAHRRRWLLAGLEGGHYLQFIDDNLDWVGAILRIAHAWTAKFERGVHVLTREVYLLGDLPVDIDSRSDAWKPNRSHLSTRDVVHLSPLQEKMRAAYAIRFCASAVCTNSRESEVDVYVKARQKQQLTADEVESTRMDLASRPAPRVAQLDASGNRVPAYSHGQAEVVDGDDADDSVAYERLQINRELCYTTMRVPMDAAQVVIAPSERARLAAEYGKPVHALGRSHPGGEHLRDAQH